MPLSEIVDAGMLMAVPAFPGAQPPKLNSDGVAYYRMVVPERRDRWPSFVIAVRVDRIGELGYTLTAPVHAFHRPPTLDGLLALSRLSRRFHSAHGAVFNVNEADQTVVIVRHTILPTITAEQFKHDFTHFCRQARTWAEAFLAGREDPTLFFDPRLVTFIDP